MAAGTYSLCSVYRLARVAGEVFHRRASMTGNVSVSNTNGLPVKILFPYIFCYFYTPRLSQLQSLNVLRSVSIPFDIFEKTILVKHKVLLKIAQLFSNLTSCGNYA